MTRIYYYSWGNEDLLSAEIEIIHDSDEYYTIKFDQEATEARFFYDIVTKGTLINCLTTEKETDMGICRKMEIKIKMGLNPRPEEIFKFV